MQLVVVPLGMLNQEPKELNDEGSFYSVNPGSELGGKDWLEGAVSGLKQKDSRRGEVKADN